MLGVGAHLGDAAQPNRQHSIRACSGRTNDPGHRAHFALAMDRYVLRVGIGERTTQRMALCTVRKVVLSRRL